MPDAADPQALNRYIYVGNNPLVYVDPTGHCWGLSGKTQDLCTQAAIGVAPYVHKANEYRDDIFFPNETTTFSDRTEAAIGITVSTVVIGSATYLGLSLAGGAEAIALASKISFTGLTGSSAAATANIAGQAINKARTGEEIDYEETVIAGTVGYAAGAIAPVGATTYYGASALGGLSTTSQYALNQLHQGAAVEPEGVLYNSGLGSIFGLMAGPVPRGESAFATYSQNSAIREYAIYDSLYDHLWKTARASSIARAVLSGVGTTLEWEQVRQEISQMH